MQRCKHRKEKCQNLHVATGLLNVSMNFQVHASSAHASGAASAKMVANLKAMSAGHVLVGIAHITHITQFTIVAAVNAAKKKTRAATHAVGNHA